MAGFSKSRWLQVLWAYPYRLHSSSVLGLPYRIPNMKHKRELLWSLWVEPGSGWLFRGPGGMGL